MHYFSSPLLHLALMLLSCYIGKVWPDLSKLCHFGKTLKVFGLFNVYLYLPKFFMLLGKFSLLYMDQDWKIIWPSGHTVESFTTRCIVTIFFSFSLFSTRTARGLDLWRSESVWKLNNFNILSQSFFIGRHFPHAFRLP